MNFNYVAVNREVPGAETHQLQQLPSGVASGKPVDMRAAFKGKPTSKGWDDNSDVDDEPGTGKGKAPGQPADARKHSGGWDDASDDEADVWKGKGKSVHGSDKNKEGSERSRCNGC